MLSAGALSVWNLAICLCQDCHIHSGLRGSAPVWFVCPRWWPEQAIVGAPNDAVALAGGSLETRAVGDLHPAGGVADEARLLERACSDGDPGPAHPEHHGHE